MKGIVFNLLEGVVSAEYGEDTWDSLLTSAGVTGAYTCLGGYPDQELYQLVGAASKALGKEPDEIVQWFARNALPLMARKYPDFFRPHQCTRSFLLTLNEVIHPEVRKLFPGADVPVFDFDTSSPDVLVMIYRSHRKLCTFALGLIEGAAQHYGESLVYEHPVCMKQGGSECVLRLSFNRQNG